MVWVFVHLMTLVFGASLVGVAQDYGIYFLCNRLSADASLDSRALLKKLLPGLALTLLAAVIGYMGLALTPFPRLRQMAVFSALGLIFAWLTVICWFPQLIGPRSLKGGALVHRYGAALAHWTAIPILQEKWLQGGESAAAVAPPELRPNLEGRTLVFVTHTLAGAVAMIVGIVDHVETA